MPKAWKVVLGVTTIGLLSIGACLLMVISVAIGEGETLAARGIVREPAASEPPTAGLADGG